MYYADIRWLVAVLCGLMVGCGLDRSRGLGPGTLRQQQIGATSHDPYFDNDFAPEVVGGRPREFQKPLAEPARNQPRQQPFVVR